MADDRSRAQWVLAGLTLLPVAVFLGWLGIAVLLGISLPVTLLGGAAIVAGGYVWERHLYTRGGAEELTRRAMRRQIGR